MNPCPITTEEVFPILFHSTSTHEKAELRSPKQNYLKNQLFFCHYSMNVDRKENAPA
jgi:ABC-type antimicrobial peptide transport system ATPase subunit